MTKLMRGRQLVRAPNHGEHFVYWVFGAPDGTQAVEIGDTIWSVETLSGMGYTFTPLVEMPPDRVAALEYALLKLEVGTETPLEHVVALSALFDELHDTGEDAEDDDDDE